MTVSDQIARWFRTLCKFGVPIVAAVFATAILADQLNRWPVAASALSTYPGQTAILIGSDYRSAGEDWRRSARYVLFPSLRSIEIDADNKSPPRVNETSYGLLGLVMSVFWLFLALVLSVRYWRRPDKTAPPTAR